METTVDLDALGPGLRKGEAVLLFSGGIDSATLAVIAQALGMRGHLLTVDYGQRHRAEIDAARALAAAMPCVTQSLVLDARDLICAGSSLTDAGAPVPTGRTGDEIRAGAVPDTFVPNRNLVLLSIAWAWASRLGVNTVGIGANGPPGAGYPDTRPEFIERARNLMRAVCGPSSTVWAPLLDMRKSVIIRTGLALGADYSQTLSCYDPKGGLACGICDACALRLEGFAENGVADPASYAARE